MPGYFRRTLLGVLLLALYSSEAIAQPGSAAFLEQSGQVVMEAENSHAQRAAGGQVVDGADDAGGVRGGERAAVLAEHGGGDRHGHPDDGGGAAVSGAVCDGGHVSGVAAGVCRDDERQRGPRGAERAGGGDGGQDVAGDARARTRGSTRRSDGPVATLVIPTAGVHTINVWMREDGFYLDRLLLTTSPASAGGQWPGGEPARGRPPPTNRRRW